jgi:hypothetical protein
VRATFFKGVALGSAVSLVTLAATAAFAGTGVGKVFNLGEDNRVNARSQLEGATPSAVLKVTNSDKSPTASGVAIDVPASDPPLVVNSATKVKNLNADLLDGHRASEFQGATSKACPLGSAMSSVAPDGSAACNSPVVLPLQQHMPTNGATVTLPPFSPSTIQLALYCPGTYAAMNPFDTGAPAEPATVSYSYGGNAVPTVVGTTDLFTATSSVAIEASAVSQIVGQLIYIDSATLTTINFTAMNEGADGCEFEGTVTIARR